MKNWIIWIQVMAVPRCYCNTKPQSHAINLLEWIQYIIAWDRVFCEIYRHEHEGELPCILHKTRGFLMLYVFYITTTPYLPCNKNRKELYDFYYTAITLTTGYKDYLLHPSLTDRLFSRVLMCSTWHVSSRLRDSPAPNAVPCVGGWATKLEWSMRELSRLGYKLLLGTVCQYNYYVYCISCCYSISV